MELALVLAVVLKSLMPSFEADTARFSADPCGPGRNAERLAKHRLYVAYCGPTNWKWVLLRQHAVTAGATDTFSVDDSQCTTYRRTAVDSAGNESCDLLSTVGTPPVGVAPDLAARQKMDVYDLQGRVVHPLRAGVYFSRDKRRRIVLIR